MRVDLVVVGAGVVGLGHALEAVSRGLSVAVVEREDRPLGASVRNFGHGCITAQSDAAHPHAVASRERWLRLAREAGFWAGETGTVVVARAGDELEVLRSLAAERNGDGIVMLTGKEADARAGTTGSVGGAHLMADIRVDPRTAAPAIARWLHHQGVVFRWSTSALSAESGGVRTSRGDIEADHVVVCVGHDLDRLFPDVADDVGLRRCSLRMLRVKAPAGRAVRPTASPAVLTGSSMLRYAALARQPAAVSVRDRMARDRPEFLDLDVNLMFTQHPSGDLLVGDTHEYGTSVDPFQPEHIDALLLDEMSGLLGARTLEVVERWQGVYASAPGEFLIRQPRARTTIVAVTSGIGMTTGLGLAAHVVDRIVAGFQPSA